MLAEGAAIQSAPRAIVERQSVNEPLPPVSLFPQKLTLQNQQKPAWDMNVAPQSGGPDKFGPIGTPGGGQFAGFTLRF